MELYSVQTCNAYSEALHQAFRTSHHNSSEVMQGLNCALVAVNQMVFDMLYKAQQKHHNSYLVIEYTEYMKERYRHLSELIDKLGYLSKQEFTDRFAPNLKQVDGHNG